MTQLGPEKVGAFVQQHGEDLVRIWRIARADARTDVFPGLLDGVIGPFLASCSALLATGRGPDDVWRETAGLIRWPLALSPGEHDEEWSLVGEVLAAACESTNARSSVASWLERAVLGAREGTRALAGRRGAAPPGVLTVLVYSPVAPRRARAEATGSVA